MAISTTSNRYRIPLQPGVNPFNNPGRFWKLLDCPVPIRVKIENRSSAPRTYTLAVKDVPEATIVMPRTSYQLAPGKPAVLPIFIESPATAFVHGQRSARVDISDDKGWHTSLAITVLGPEQQGRTP